MLVHLFLTDTRTVMHNSTGETCMKLNAESKSLDRQNMSIYISILAADLTRCSLFERCTVLIGGSE